MIAGIIGGYVALVVKADSPIETFSEYFQRDLQRPVNPPAR